ncbi:MAG: hypothetical protein ABI549_02900 [Flavobacterium sp.]|uniref:hypothetical protein n=1 Tax=Flavobacterium sp. TaxID=239 RepID=UPI0032635EE4
MKKYLLLVLAFILFSSCNSTKIENSKTNFSLEKLCDEWLYVNSYEGILTKIDTLNKEVKKYKYYTPSLTYRKEGTYTNYQGDYQDNGTFIFNKKTGIIKEFYNMGSTKVESQSRLTYLDNGYLLMVVFENEKESTSTFFYKKR